GGPHRISTFEDTKQTWRTGTRLTVDVMATVGVVELRTWLLLLPLCLTLWAEMWQLAAATIQGYIGDRDMICPSVCRCDEDFIYCNDRGLSAIPPLPSYASVLYLQNNQVNNQGLPTSLEHHLTVQVVYLYDNELDDFPVHLPPSLRELHLQDNNIRTVPRSALARMPLLEKLHLDDNSISTVSIEDQAFADNPRLRLLFLSRNHLSSIPSGLPASLEELPHRRRHLLPPGQPDGGLSLVRNSLQTPPINLPTAHLQRLSLQDNAADPHAPGIPDGMRGLQRLDLSGNNLTTCPGPVQRRGQPGPAPCTRESLALRLQPALALRLAALPGGTASLSGASPATVRKRGCETGRWWTWAARWRECEVSRTTGNRDRVGGAGGPMDTSTTLSPAARLPSSPAAPRRPGLGLPDSGLDYTLGRKSLALNVKPLLHNSVRLLFRLSWLRLGTGNTMGSITETLVRGDRREYLLNLPAAPAD
ncbi:hypothetical protein CRUP_038163, partial [Coryphaenoides rupestris]